MMTVDSFTEKMPVIINGESFPVTNTQPTSGNYMTIYATNIKSMTLPSRQVPEDIKTIDVTNATLTYHAGEPPSTRLYMNTGRKWKNRATALWYR